MIQTKEQYKTSEKEINKVGISNLPGKEFQVMIVNMLNNLSRRIDKHSEKF